MLIQISENSAAVTPYGSLAQIYRNVGNVSGSRSGAARALSIKMLWRLICTLTLRLGCGGDQKHSNCSRAAAEPPWPRGAAHELKVNRTALTLNRCIN
jgi:hypothetical protein